MTDWIGGGVIVASLLAVVGTLWLIRYLNRYRGDLGAGWFMAALAAQALWIASYTVGLVVFDPFWRATLEAITWIGIASLGPLFLGFALVYTGRSGLVESLPFRLLFVVPVGTALIAATHPLQTLLWSDFRVDPLLGLATVRYTVTPLEYVLAFVSLASAGVGALLLVETIVSYGPLYKREAIAVTLSTVPPAVGVALWLFELTPWPAFNPAPLFFLPHVVLDGYAFVGTHMFETTPRTQRAAEESALSKLNEPLLVVDPDGRVVNMNERALALFDVAGDTLPQSVTSVVGTDLETIQETEQLQLEGQRETVYSVSTTRLTDASGADVGSILVFYDITHERQQQQRLSVLNRILRHNLRNKLSISNARAELIRSNVEDPEIQEYAETLITANEELLSIAEKVRAFQRVRDRDRHAERRDVVAVIETIATEMETEYPDAELTVKNDLGRSQLETDVETLKLAVRNLVENAIVHADGDSPPVEIRLQETDPGTVTVEIRDANERIPPVEIETLAADEETSLQHGQGFGLWLTNWCVTAISGALTFDYEDGNAVRVTLPRTLQREEDATSDSVEP